MASHRRTAAAGFAVILASVSLYPVFTGVLWFWAGCASVIVVALAGTLARLRRLPVAADLALGIVALLLYLNLAFSNARSLAHLLPTPASLGALLDLAGQGFDEASKYAPPVPELRGMVLLAAAGIGIAALFTDLIAVRYGSAALAGLPLLLLFTEPFTLSLSRGFLGTTIAFCAGVAGYLALLSSEAKDRIRAWEQPNPDARDQPDTRTLAAAGRRVGFASVVIALCLPLFIPGLHVTRLFGGGPGIGGSGGSGGSGPGGNGAAGAIGFPSPTLQLTDELRNSRATPVLTYTTNDTQPGYLQIYSLGDLTDGSGWQLSPAESLVPVGSKLPAAPGLTKSGSWLTAETTNINVDRSVGNDEFGALPVPYPTTSVKADGNLKADRSTLMLFDSGVNLGGLSYSVTSYDDNPPTQELDAAPPPPASITQQDLSVPAPYDSLRSVAQSQVRAAGAKTPFEEALALQNWLSGTTFHYTLSAPTVLNAAELKNFLTTKKGYCQQFSYAMAVLARLLGIPSRVAYGFTPGELLSSGAWQVTTHDAHAWPELYFQGYGWLRFEPTPTAEGAGQPTAYAPIYTQPSVGPGTSPVTLPNTGLSTSPAGAGQGGHVRVPLPPEDTGGQAPASSTGTVSPWAVLGLVVAGLIVVAAAAPWCARRMIRRRRWRRRAAGTARADRVLSRDVAWAHAAWQELRDDLADYGTASRPSESPRAVAARAGADLPLAGPARAALGRIALAEERARYAPAPADGSGLRTDSVTVRRAIAAAVPGRARWRARLLPASVVGPALNAVASAADLYRGSRRSGRPRARRLSWPGHGDGDGRVGERG
ncbi:MAG TPA: transglutaminaseTgpA domain-containing protein [Trebonia sp.]